MLKILFSSIGWLYVLSAITFLGWHAHAAEIPGETAHHCNPTSPVNVFGATQTERELICRASAKAISFLAEFEITVHSRIEIHLSDATITSEGYLAYGSYDRIKDQIVLMSYEAISKGGDTARMYNEPFDLVHYQGAVAHEVAHAVVQQNMTEIPISPSSQEYLAHATQLAVLPTERRKLIIKKADVGPWLPGDTISDIYMAIEPTGFAVKSYLHLMSLTQPQDFIRILLGSKWFYVSVPDY